MANLGRKGGIYHVRFRFRRKEYKRSLKVRERADAEAARRTVEQTIHRVLTGLLTVPAGVDPGDFIVSGGTLTAFARRSTYSWSPGRAISPRGKPSPRTRQAWFRWMRIV